MPGQPSVGKAPPAAAAQVQAAPPAQAPNQEALARQLQQLGPLPLEGAVISQFLAGLHTGQPEHGWAAHAWLWGPGWPQTHQRPCRWLGRSIAVSLCLSDMTSTFMAKALLPSC